MSLIYIGDPHHLPKTFDILKLKGLTARISAERAIAIRPFIYRGWLDKLVGEAEGMHSVRE